ncbi:MAG TPA: hypothetical protein VN721_16360 [Flavipsychrobacter sp.]|nr:hypothetical protein [Flavipsychrobacter sp.]
MKRNVPIFGLVIGLLLPVVGMLIIYLAWFHGMPTSDFFSRLAEDHSLAAKVLSLGLLINIVPFIFYTNKRLDLTARGILIATILYAVLIILIKYAW